MSSRDPGAWFQQPVAWLGMAILVASITGCIATIVLALRHADTPVDAGGGTVLKAPLRSTATAPPSSESR